MKVKSRRMFFSIMIFSLLTLFWACNKKKDNIEVTRPDLIFPHVSTTEISDIADNQAVCGGSITYDGGSGLLNCGICWSSDSIIWRFVNCAFAGYDYDIKTEGKFNFKGSITGLLPNSKYVARAYASNINGTSYGNAVTFTTLPSLVVNIDFNPGVNYNYVFVQDGNIYRTVTPGARVWIAKTCAPENR